MANLWRLTSGEVTDDLWGEVAGHLLHVVDGADGQGAGYDDYARSRHAERGYPGLGGPGEGTGDDANRRNAPGFGYHCVVETPRRAGASIGNAVDHRVAFLGQRVQRLLSAGRAVGEFGGVNYLFGAVFIDKDSLQLLHKGVGVVFAVLQQAYDLTLQARRVELNPSSSGTSSALGSSI